MTDENEIRIFDPMGEDSWDAQIASHPHASIFHSAKWARVLGATYGHVPHYLGVMKGNQPRALLPIMEVNSPLTGRRGVSLPFSDECGLLCFGESRGDAIIQNALELGRTSLETSGTARENIRRLAAHSVGFVRRTRSEPRRWGGGSV